MAFLSLPSSGLPELEHISVGREHNDVAVSNRDERTISGRIGARWKSSRSRCMAACPRSGARMPMPIAYAPLRTLRDVEELERVPLDERIFSWDLNDWIARG